jgi:DNA-binding IclR family transcriptional regulator
MSLSGLAHRAELPLSTTHRLVEELLGHGLIERLPTGRLRLGLRMWELASRGSHALGLRETAVPFMQDVRAVVRQHTTLAVLDHGSVLYVERLSEPSSPLGSANVAQRMPVHASSSGLVLLAYADAGFREQVLGSPLQQLTPETLVDPLAIRRHLTEIRERGYVALHGAGVSEWTGIAVPVFGPGNQVVAALNIIAARDAVRVPAVLPSLLTAAHGISRALKDASTLR